MQERLAIRDSRIMHLTPDHPLAGLGPTEAETLYPLSSKGRVAEMELLSTLSGRIAQLDRTRSDGELEDLVTDAVEHTVRRRSLGDKLITGLRIAARI